jgi:hypothetical protein
MTANPTGPRPWHTDEYQHFQDWNQRSSAAALDAARARGAAEARQQRVALEARRMSRQVRAAREGRPVKALAPAATRRRIRKAKRSANLFLRHLGILFLILAVLTAIVAATR